MQKHINNHADVFYCRSNLLPVKHFILKKNEFVWFLLKLAYNQYNLVGVWWNFMTRDLEILNGTIFPIEVKCYLVISGQNSYKHWSALSCLFQCFVWTDEGALSSGERWGQTIGLPCAAHLQRTAWQCWTSHPKLAQKMPPPRPLTWAPGGKKK